LWREYVAFRDHLRADPAAARRYGELKEALAARFPHDRESYINGKSEFVRELLSRAPGEA